MNSNNMTIDNVNEFKNNMIIINSYSDMHTKEELNDFTKQKGLHQETMHRR